MTDYIPTTQEIRERWCTSMILDQLKLGNHAFTSEAIKAEFGRWLNTVKAEAWDEGFHVGHAHGFGDGTQPCERANPYRKEAT